MDPFSHPFAYRDPLVDRDVSAQYPKLLTLTPLLLLLPPKTKVILNYVLCPTLTAALTSLPPLL